LPPFEIPDRITRALRGRKGAVGEISVRSSHRARPGIIPRRRDVIHAGLCLTEHMNPGKNTEKERQGESLMSRHGRVIVTFLNVTNVRLLV
jgi:hypothetical protein